MKKIVFKTENGTKEITPYQLFKFDVFLYKYWDTIDMEKYCSLKIWQQKAQKAFNLKGNIKVDIC